MLSISNPIKSVAGALKYYLGLAFAAYYLNGADSLATWFGRGAEKLGLSGEVKREDFRNLLLGYRPDGVTPLVQNAGDKDRTLAHDLVFNAPKSVSLLWSQGSEGIRRIIEECHDAAVKKGFSFLEQEAGLSRTGKGGKKLEKADLIFVLCEHYTSRADDPHLHTHGVLINAGFRQNGTSGALWTQKIFDLKTTAGSVYQAEFAARLQSKLGWEIESTRDGFEVAGVSSTLISEFSKRRQQIEASLTEHRTGGAINSKVAALDTRPPKSHRPLPDLLAEWQAIGRQHGFAERPMVPKPLPENPRLKAEQVAGEVVERLCEDNGNFTKHELIRATCLEGIKQGIPAADLLHAVGTQMRRHEVLPCGFLKRERLHTLKHVRDWHRQIEADAAEAVRSMIAENLPRAATPAPELVKSKPSVPLVTEPERKEIQRAIAQIESLALAANSTARPQQHQPKRKDNFIVRDANRKNQKQRDPFFRMDVTYRRLLRRRTSLPHFEILVPRIRVRIKNPILIYDTGKMVRFLKKLFDGEWPRLKNALLYQRGGMKLVLAYEKPNVTPSEALRLLTGPRPEDLHNRLKKGPSL